MTKYLKSNDYLSAVKPILIIILKKELSSRSSILRRKFFLSWFLPLVAGLVVFGVFKPFFWTVLLFCLAGLVGLFFANLSRVFFDNQYIYIRNQQFSFTDLHKVKMLDINNHGFILLKIKQHGRVRWYFTDPGSVGFMQALYSIFVQKKDPVANITAFFERYEVAKKERQQGLKR